MHSHTRSQQVGRHHEDGAFRKPGRGWGAGGLRSDNDEAFSSRFTEMYHHAVLQVPWYSVLGPIDYGLGAPCHPSSSNCTYTPLHQVRCAFDKCIGQDLDMSERCMLVWMLARQWLVHASFRTAPVLLHVLAA